MARATGGAPQFVDARRIHPWWMKGLNAVGGLMPRHARLSAAQLWERASKHPRLHSVLPTSAAREALEVLVDSINREARLSWVGRLVARDDMLRLAVHRSDKLHFASGVPQVFRRQITGFMLPLVMRSAVHTRPG